MSKILCLGDCHLADKPPSSCTDSYLEDLFELMGEARSVAAARKVDAVVQAGDLMHIKTPGRTSHKLVQRTIEALASFPCPVFVVPGNHCMLQDRFDSIFETQPLGVVLRSGAASLLSGWADAPSHLGKPLDELRPPEGVSLPLYGVPWLQSWNAEESVADQEVKLALQDFRSRFDGSINALVVTHAPFYPPGTELKYEFYPTSRFADLMGNAGSVYYGHVHERHGQYVNDGVRFCNHGALSRGSLHEHNLSREVAVTIWDSKTGLFEEVILPHRPASEVFRIQESVEIKSAQAELDAFLTSIGQTTIEVTSIESVLAHVKDLGLDAEVVRIVEELLAEASGV